MWKDPIVEEVREAGAKLAKRCGYDFHKFSKMIKEHQDSSKKTVISKDKLKERVGTEKDIKERY